MSYSRHEPRISFLLGAMILFFAPTVFAQEDRWDESSCKVVSLPSKEAYGEALQIAQQAVPAAEITFDDGDAKPAATHEYFVFQDLRKRNAETERLYKEVARLNKLANAYYHRRQYTQAERLYKRAIKIAEAEKALGPEHPDLATILENLASLYKSQGKYGDAAPLYERIVEIDEKTLGSESPQLEEGLHELANVYVHQGRPGEAAELLQRAIGIEQALDPKSAETATLLNDLATIYYQQGKYWEAAPLNERALHIAEKALGPENAALPTLLNNLANVYYNQGRYGEAVQLAQRAIKIDEKALGPESPVLATDLNNLAMFTYLGQGNYAEAERLLKRASKIDDKALRPGDLHRARDLNNLAILYKHQGRYGEAEPLYKQSLAMREKVLKPEDPLVAESLNNLAALYDDQGDYDHAAPLYQRAIQIDEKALGTADFTLARDLSNLATLYERWFRYADGEVLSRQALKIGENALGPEDPRLATLVNNLALLYDDQGKYDQAEPLYKRVMKIIQKAVGPEHPDLAATLYNIAEHYNAWKQPKLAEKFFDCSLAIDFRILTDQFGYMSETERLQFLETVRFHFPEYMSFASLYYRDQPELAGKIYNLLLWEKGIVARSEAALRAKVAASGDKEALALWDGIVQTNAQLVQLSAALPTEPRPRERALADIARLAEQKNALASELAQRSALFAQDTKFSEGTWQDVRDRLKPSEAAVEFVRFEFQQVQSLTLDAHYAALVITPATKTYPAFIPLGDAIDLECGAMNDYATKVAGSNRFPCRVRQTDGLVPTAPRFYESFWEPLEAALGGARRVYFSPDGVLTEVSLAIVADRDGKLLLDKYDLRMLNSTHDLLREPREHSERTAVFVGAPNFDLDGPKPLASAREVAQSPAGRRSGVSAGSGYGLDTLRGSTFDPLDKDEKEIEAAMRTEVQHLNSFLRGRGWSTSLYTDERAVVEVVKNVHHPRLLHLATHGEFAEDRKPALNARRSLDRTAHPALLDDPMLRSALFFAGANRFRKGRPPAEGMDNGVLTAYEAAGLDLEGTELVVLSACESGLGSVRNGEGVFGLRRALQEAGAGAILMSMWKVPSKETAELMQLFYEKWLSGEDKPLALQDAQRELRKKLLEEKGYDDRYSWGAFVLIGN